MHSGSDGDGDGSSSGDNWRTAAPRRPPPIPWRERTFRQMGAGACGVIFVPKDGCEGKVIKIAKKPDYFATELSNEWEMHNRIAAQFGKVIFDVRIPQCFYYHRKDYYCFLQHCQASLARGFGPIERFWDPDSKQQALDDLDNKDCLVRVYLGSMEGGKSQSQDQEGAEIFSLRDFEMHLDQMAELDLNIVGMARRIGMSLAMMHWMARADACGVEFVLSSPATLPNLALAVDFNKEPASGPRPPAQMWILDFNQVREITLDDEGVKLAVEAVELNGPSFPKPPMRSGSEPETHFIFGSDTTSGADLDTGEDSLRGMALGILRSYALLMPTELDFILAHEARLFPSDVTWEAWAPLVPYLTFIPDGSVSKRFHFGQLLLSPLNWCIRPLQPLSAESWWFYDGLARLGSTTNLLYQVFIPLIFVFAALPLRALTGLDIAAMQRVFVLCSLVVLGLLAIILLLMLLVPAAVLIAQLVWIFTRQERHTERRTTRGSPAAV
ncbi:hypothetical protein B0H63DRAFT_527516 [Podospora didyma]|uniref:DUF3669 domain-containing protein n=1 Tax=Podospora didyma TaxID=330526 RepID=A0AAE0N7W1_9PEZI|nr:hypothetical protein B0H63DRAFT_527516 [Podospora didyma]